MPFTGERAAEKPMTLGQLNILEWLSGAPGHPYATLGAELADHGLWQRVHDRDVQQVHEGGHEDHGHQRRRSHAPTVTANAAT
ncbi:hypothetical protein ACFQ1S_22045 [Kibdelosporangium lantanae]|uniref:PadR family transcriptional regulator n=1 Tax=Kibdelosporangium lantanae TaxID=1497396 RepID=A0ABW3MCJ2_9PSEU